MKWEGLRGNAGFLCNRGLEFEQLIWKKKPMPDIMSGSTDIHTGRRGFLVRQCSMSGAYLQPCTNQFAIRKASWFKPATLAYS